MLSRSSLAVLVAVSSVSLLAGCPGSGRRTGGGTDSGTPLDLGTPHDSGPGVDLGPHDAGTAGHDSGPGFDAGPPGDAGACGAAVPRLTAPGAYCAMTTFDCLTAASCTTAACVDGCYGADPDPTNCQNCVVNANIACANSNGCMTQYHDLDCCASANCPAGSATDCVTTMCGTQSDAYNTCYAAHGPNSADMPACGGDAAHCFNM